MFAPTKAPWIRPGAIIHETPHHLGPLLLDFTESLRERGFKIAGLLQTPHESGFDLIHLNDGHQTRVATVIEAMMAASHSLRAAMREDADLVVLNHYAGFSNAARQMRSTFKSDISQGMPVLTAIQASELPQWLEQAGQSGSLLPPTARALWQWWGTERLYADLAQGVARDEVRDIVVGPRWLMVQGPAGVGLAYLPRTPRDLLSRLAALRQLSLRELAELTHSWDPLDMAVGIAAINAHYNRFDLDALPGNGADQFGQEAGRVVVVGAFPGLSDTLPKAQVIEHEPREGEYPTVAMDTLLPGCAATVVASSSLINRNLPRVLRLAHGSRVAVVGPSTPLTPRLYAYGAEILGGLVVHNPQGLAAAIRSGALPRDFTHFARYRHIRPQSLSYDMSESRSDALR